MREESKELEAAELEIEDLKASISENAATLRAVEELVLQPLGFYFEESANNRTVRVCLNLGMGWHSSRAEAIKAALEKAKELGLLKRE